MKFVFTGAGGGHFYPLIAVAEALRAESVLIAGEAPEFFFFSDQEYDTNALAAVNMTYIYIPAGKLRVYASFENILDMFKTAYGIVIAFFKLFSVYPDAIFAKGGYASFPTLFAARILGIPVIIHESDALAGRVTKWAGSFAEKVAVSQETALVDFDKTKTALTGQPVRTHLLPPKFYKRDTIETKKRKTLLILGGSQGSKKINDTILPIIPNLLNTFDIVHQTGKDHEISTKLIVEALIKDSPFKDRYYVSGFIDLSLYYPRTDILISRAGSTTLFEAALWQIPSIVIPIPETISRDQTKNAYHFASLGTCTVIEESNLTPVILESALLSMIENEAKYSSMVEAGEKVSSSRDAALTIAKEMLKIATSHT